jgi:crossover junction endonuclease MUS81
MNIILDNRENSLINIFKTYNSDNINVSVQQLALGDILIKEKEKEIILIERKTYADLLASIKDGRFNEQSYRLSNTREINTHSIIYLIEGDINKYDEVEKKMLYSAITSLYYYKGFSVMKTNSVNESYELIKQMTEKIYRENLKNTKNYLYINQPIIADISGNELSAINYCDVVKKVKKDNVVKENIGQIMLSQIPGVSSTSAIAILKDFENFSQFMKKISESTEFLNEITTEAKGKKRKISKNTIKKIVDYLT